MQPICQTMPLFFFFNHVLSITFTFQLFHWRIDLFVFKWVVWWLKKWHLANVFELLGSYEHLNIQCAYKGWAGWQAALHPHLAASACNAVALSDLKNSWVLMNCVEFLKSCLGTVLKQYWKEPSGVSSAQMCEHSVRSIPCKGNLVWLSASMCVCMMYGLADQKLRLF